MKTLCNLSTKKIEDFSRWGDISFNLATHVVLDVDYIPDFENERLNDTNDGLRPATQAEIDADVENKKDEESQELKSTKIAFASVLDLLWDAIPDLQTAYPNPGGKGKLKQAAIKAYRDRL